METTTLIPLPEQCLSKMRVAKQHTLLLRREEFLVMNSKNWFRLDGSVLKRIHADFMKLLNKVQMALYTKSTYVAGRLAVNCRNLKKKQISAPHKCP
jgi:hypothetical protein